jgi:hypothetical protein
LKGWPVALLGGGRLSQRLPQHGDDFGRSWMITCELAHIAPPDPAARINDRDPALLESVPLGARLSESGTQRVQDCRPRSRRQSYPYSAPGSEQRV